MYHVAASIVADETNSGVTLTPFVAEITSMCAWSQGYHGLRWDGIAAVNSLDYLPLSS